MEIFRGKLSLLKSGELPRITAMLLKISSRTEKTYLRLERTEEVLAVDKFISALLENKAFLLNLVDE